MTCRHLEDFLKLEGRWVKEHIKDFDEIPERTEEKLAVIREIYCGSVCKYRLGCEEYENYKYMNGGNEK